MFTTRKSKNLNPTDFVYLTDTCALLPEDPEAKGIPAVDPCIGIGSYRRTIRLILERDRPTSMK